MAAGTQVKNDVLFTSTVTSTEATGLPFCSFQEKVLKEEFYLQFKNTYYRELEDKYYLAENRRKSSCSDDSWPAIVNIYIGFRGLQSSFQHSFNLFYIFAIRICIPTSQVR